MEHFWIHHGEQVGEISLYTFLVGVDTDYQIVTGLVEHSANVVVLAVFLALVQALRPPCKYDQPIVLQRPGVELGQFYGSAQVFVSAEG